MFARHGVLVTALHAAAITMFVQVPSYADVYKYAPHPAVLAPALVLTTFVVVFVAMLFFDRAARLRALAGAPAVTALFLFALGIASIVLFRHESFRISHGSGSTASPAMTEPVHALLHGRHLYDVHLLGGAPASPGPGWILFNSPFTFAHVYALMVPLWLTATAVVFTRAYRRPFEVNLGLALMCMSPAFWRLLGEGHDIIAIGCALVLLVALMDRHATTDSRVVLLGIAAGLVATARVVFLPLPLLLALFLSTRSRRHAAIFAAVGVGTAAAFSAFFAIGVHPYPPFHLFTRADHRQPAANVAAAVLVTGGLAIGAIRRVTGDVTTWFGWLAACVATPLAFIAFGELQSSHFAFATWEGANYLIAGAIPVITAVLAVRARFESRLEHALEAA